MLKQALLDGMRTRCVSAMDLFAAFKASTHLTNFVKNAAAISVTLVQLEMQKLIFELSFLSVFQILERMEPATLESSLEQHLAFSLEKFLTVF